MHQNDCAVVLAAGDGKRMRIAGSKVMLPVLGKPMVEWVLTAAKQAGVLDCCLITGKCADDVRALVGERAVCVTQEERLGTGHAVMQAAGFLQKHAGGSCLVLAGDCPLISAETIAGAYAQHIAEECAATVISAVVDDPTGYGRIICDMHGGLLKIVEDKDAGEAERRIHEINSSAYWFDVDALLAALPKITNSNATGEYYLTDVIEVMQNAERRAGVYTSHSSEEILGANTQQQLLRLQKVAGAATLDRWMSEGVMVTDDSGVAIGPDVVIEPGTIIHRGVRLLGNTFIGACAEIGPDCLIVDSRIGPGCRINASQIYQSELGKKVRLGPYSHVRPNCKLADGVKIGNFVEIKNSTIGEKTSSAHLTYIGDSDIGARCNLGCGVVTVNYDGKNKYRTTVKDDAFVGCNVNLVAPVTIGEKAYLAAGSTITDDVPDTSLAIARARQTTKENWKPKWERSE